MAVFDTALQTIAADGTTEVNLVQGETYVIGMGGSFGSGTIVANFADGDGNDIPVPTLNQIDGAAQPLSITGAVIFELVALTALLKLVITGSTTPTIDVTITRVKK